MRQRLACQLVGLVALLLPAAATSWAAVQGRDRVYWLGTEDWQLCEKAGGACLVKGRRPKEDSLPRDDSRRWHVSAPIIQAESGLFLAGDPAGRDPSVCLVRRKGANTRWTFEFVLRLDPGYSKAERRLQEGPSGFTFRLKAAEGPFRNWYLAAGEATADAGRRTGEAAVRPLKLVRDVKEATVFTYIEENYYVDHK